MRVAHFSDLHLLDLTGAVPRRLFNKRFTGYMNLRLRRGHIHKPEPVRLGARSLRELGVDHVVVTGDVSNLSLEKEFDLVRELFESDMGFSPDQISVVPGNHDAYTRGAVRSRRFLKWFHPYTSSDIPGVDEHHFPFVRLRGPLALIGLSTAVPHPPFIAAGILGKRQIRRLREILAHDEVRRRTPVVLQHHPPINPSSLLKTALKGLWDAKAEVEAMAEVAHGLVLHGHEHVRLRRVIPTRSGSVEIVGATSASLLHEDERKIAGFNVYDFEQDGRLSHISTHRFDPRTKSFASAPLAHS
ncbi:MAG: metallophosphoesterase [Polyangiaceae bacterium]|nr:metallophosphoesterase [Polyangiaceae bacterium]